MCSAESRLCAAGGRGDGCEIASGTFILSYMVADSPTPENLFTKKCRETDLIISRKTAPSTAKGKRHRRKVVTVRGTAVSHWLVSDRRTDREASWSYRGKGLRHDLQPVEMFWMDGWMENVIIPSGVPLGNEGSTVSS